MCLIQCFQRLEKILFCVPENEIQSTKATLRKIIYDCQTQSIERKKRTESKYLCFLTLQVTVKVTVKLNTGQLGKNTRKKEESKNDRFSRNAAQEVARHRRQRVEQMVQVVRVDYCIPTKTPRRPLASEDSDSDSMGVEPHGEVDQLFSKVAIKIICNDDKVLTCTLVVKKKNRRPNQLILKSVGTIRDRSQ